MGDKMRTGLNNDNAYRTLESVNSWIVAADNKSSILIAFIALLVGLTSGTYGKIINVIQSDSNHAILFAVLVLILYLICLFIVLYQLIKVFIARLRIVGESEEVNLVSFISVSKLSRIEYCEMAKSISDEKLNEMILAQINVNSKIALRKMNHFNLALIFCITLIPLTIALMFIGG
mgnify:CR=1 FL=1